MYITLQPAISKQNKQNNYLFGKLLLSICYEQHISK